MPGPTFPLFPFDPNWSAIPTETLAWLTDVMESRTGVEQRRSLRLFPKKQIEYTGLHTGQERARLDNLLTSTGTHDWMLPIWWDLHHAEKDLTSQDAFIPCSTAALGQFRAGGWIMLSNARTNYEVVQIDRVESGRIYLIDRVTKEWSQGAKIYPLHRARFPEQPQLARRSDMSVLSSFKFDVTEPDILYDYPIIVNGVSGLIYKGLLARKYSRANDASIYDRESGITVGQAAMMRACAAAHDALRLSADENSRVASDGYLDHLTTLLDGFAGDGGSTGAILRQPLPETIYETVLPHWLYAARGPVGTLADTGEGYELFPSARRLQTAFASVAPESFRDLHLALTHAAEWDRRGPTRRGQWAILVEALLRTNAHGRQQGDGREVFKPWPGLPVVARENAQPSGLFVVSSHTDAATPNELGINSSNTGLNFFSRSASGDIVIDVPTSYEYSQFDVITPTSQEVENNGQPPDTQVVSSANKVLRTTRYGRNFKDVWRQGDVKGKRDQYLYVSICADREFLPAVDEAVEIELQVGEDTYACDFSPVGLKADAPKPILLPIDFFFSRTTGAVLPYDSLITQFTLAISAVEAYRVTFSGLRLVSGNTPSDVANNLAQALKGEPVAFSPGVNPFRISGYPEAGLFVGYRGQPWTAAQTVDIWPHMLGRTDGAFASYNASNLASVNPTDGGLTFPFSPVTTTGVKKSPEALLAEQNIEFLQQAQARYQIDGGELGPFAFTFLQNTPARFEFGNAPAHTWLYNNERTERDLIWQCRAVEGLANFARISYFSGSYIVYNGSGITFNGQRIYYANSSKDIPISFQEARAFIDAVNKAKVATMNFLTWFSRQYGYTASIVYEGQKITYNGMSVTYQAKSSEESLYKLPAWIDNPVFGAAPYDDSPEAAAVVLRACLWALRWEDGNAPTVRPIMVQAWKYINRFWTTVGPMPNTWFSNVEKMRWWYAELILTYAELLRGRDYVPTEIDLETVEERLVATLKWLDTTGVQIGELIPGLDYSYEGTSVLTKSPNEVNNMTVSFQRLTEDFDNGISIPMRAEYDPAIWNRPQYTWWIKGRQEHDTFKKMLYALRGRAVPFWLPTNFADFILVQPVAAGDTFVDVENVAFTASGGPRSSRQHVMFRFYDGTFEFREIVLSEELNADVERLHLDRSFKTAFNRDDVHRISFMDLSRFDQDGIQIAHNSDVDGVSTSTTVFKSVKDL